MTLEIEEKVLAAILEHGRREMPNEACGYLAAKNGVVGCHLELTNQDAAPDHFTMDPAEQFAAMRKMREEGLQMAAVYHTHPETPARPSEEDIRLAHDPAMVYVIVSLLTGVEPIRAFRINRGEVSEVPIRVLAER
ncbi:M67 family metallopeptidase [Desulfurivibrio alkaliphilus]|uniref:Mov34/MPN/PAD-1 family protein n=1 Tax=Desulfurivibrio alkaliphilus (strain DSM 19089 / UNIQEM U267 / AHT2) TaxID=589865 RepID=D6Z1Z8_DESAT|nr:M67 family metallopeptidase [Desulfurivibrio alkaliphilus]ADH85573.1 Mov34/MPN/PAD-1 family protein [Desulfurivibrio alkaliphilus AHT 2]